MDHGKIATITKPDAAYQSGSKGPNRGSHSGSRPKAALEIDLVGIGSQFWTLVTHHLPFF
jgi:hypothetical protein